MGKSKISALDLFLCDISYEIDNVDFTDNQAEDDSFQYIADTLKIALNDDNRDTYLTEKIAKDITKILNDTSKSLQKSYMDILCKYRK